MAKTFAHKAKKRFGQNFLHDQNIIGKIVKFIAPETGDRIIEIGPGQGAMTRPVIEHVGVMDVIELDRDLIPILERDIAPLGELRIINQDALTVDLTAIAKEYQKQLRVIGNLPYNISSPLLFHFVEHIEHIQDMHFMLQEEVVDRICAAPGSKTYGRLSVMMQYHCKAIKLFHVPPGAFNPPPKVDSAIVRLIPLTGDRERTIKAHSYARFETLVKSAFAQRRKTLRNTLKGLLTAEQIEAAGIEPSVRAETLSVEDFITLANQQ